MSLDDLDWPVTVLEKVQSTPSWYSASDADKAAAKRTAISILWSLTGRVFGLRDETVRPCLTPPSHGSTYNGNAGAAGAITWAGLMQGNPLTVGSCGCGAAGCPCTGSSEVALPGPIESVTAVWVNGIQLAPTAYKVRDRRWLLRVDGDRWPQAQNLDAADHAVGAFTVAYRRGIRVPADGQAAAGLLTVEILQGMTTGGPCSLPKNVVSVAQQGVSAEIDPVAYLEEGLTGVEFVDQWVRAVNPDRRRQRARIVSPDGPRVVRLS